MPQRKAMWHTWRDLSKSFNTNIEVPKSLVRPPFSTNEVVNYLKHPTRVGVWKLQFEWNTKAQIGDMVLDAVALLCSESSIQGRLAYDGVNVSALISPTMLEAYVRQSLSFPLELIGKLAAEDGDEIEFGTDLFINNMRNVIFDAMERSAIRNRFAEALELFKTQIYFPGIFASKLPDKPFYTRSGFIVDATVAPEVGRILYSLNEKCLSDLKQFLSLLNIAHKEILMPVFAPEDQILLPYFTITNEAYEIIIEDGSHHSLLKKACSEYNEERFDSCISTIGRVAEHYLTNIYETLFRDLVPNNATIGQLVDRINSQTANAFPSKTVDAGDVDSLYKAVGTLINKGKAGDAVAGIDILAIVRDVVTCIKDDRAHLTSKLKSLTRITTYSIFPARIADNLYDLLRYRNAASHKTRTTLGQFEASRAMYCAMSIILWWQEELAVIDWHDDPLGIIKKLVERSDGAT